MVPHGGTEALGERRAHAADHPSVGGADQAGGHGNSFAYVGTGPGRAPRGFRPPRPDLPLFFHGTQDECVQASPYGAIPTLEIVGVAP